MSTFFRNEWKRGKCLLPILSGQNVDSSLPFFVNVRIIIPLRFSTMTRYIFSCCQRAAMCCLYTKSCVRSTIIMTTKITPIIQRTLTIRRHLRKLSHFKHVTCRAKTLLFSDFMAGDILFKKLQSHKNGTFC